MLTLSQWLTRLETLHPEEIELGLERVAEVARRLQLLPVACPVVSVAGTNGKGSTVAVLDALLRGKGLRTGVYSSPHLLRYNERVRIDGVEVDDARLVEAFERVEAARAQTPLTYFEFGTLAALDIFRFEAVQVQILEVGLGGRLDAVNIVDPQVAVITSIALDHEAWLGNDLESIAREKCGILRPGVDFVCADPNPPAAIVECAARLACNTRQLGRDFQQSSRCGSLRPENVAAAGETAKLLGYESSSVELESALADVDLPGRMQRENVAGIEVLLDVAHNPAAVVNLAQQLAQTAVKGRRIALFCALSDKNIHAMIHSCMPLVEAWFVADLPGVSRAATASQLAQELRDAGVSRVSESRNPKQAYRRAMSLLGPGDQLVIFGSFFTVAALLPAVKKDRDRQ